ncbi:MAG: hypothetical protein VZQ98_02420, partial [Bacteroidales bacterium]|nr:hypothetical protein [Bacteroidales bacterium]
NFKDVTFVVVPDTMVIDPRENVVVTITKHSETVIYDGEEHTVTGYDFESTDPLYIEDYMKFNGVEADSTATGTAIGSYGMTFDETYFENINENFKDLTFVVNSDDSLVINALEGIIVTITEHADTFIYDGESHTVKGYEVAINSDLYKVSDFTFNGDSTISGTTVGKYSMPVEPNDFVNNNVNFKDVTFVVVPDTMVITPRENVIVTITKHADNVIYDGEEHTVTGYDFESTDPLYIESYMKFKGEEADSIAKGTEIGSYGMTFDETYFENINENFKDVTFIVNSNDSLVINALEGIIVTITEHADTFIYDGESHTVKGYDVAINSDLYKVSDFMFNGDSTISGTTVGKYSMPVEPSDFVNNNVNFKDVTFVVVPDTMVITPRENVVVTITKHSETVIYDGEEHIISGYDFESTDPLYIESYMKFTGEESDSIAIGTEIGSYGMSFDDTYFENINENFKDVTFVVNSNDSLVIEALKGIIVTITPVSDTVSYNDKVQTISGYSVTTNHPLYTEEYITFTGDATASGKLVGEYPMMLSADDFTNNNPNFEDVTFVVGEGGLVIEPIRTVIVRIKENAATYTYDGQEHSVYGFSITSNERLYSYVNDCEFTGKDEVSATEVGKYSMNLKESDFINKNPNFENVQFIIEHDSLVILPPSAVVVKITEHGGKFIFNDTTYVVTGYDVAIDNEVYTEADFIFKGDSVVAGTEVGKYTMELKPEDFVNINPNFTDVTFVIVDNQLIIDPIKEIIVYIKENADTFTYDGKEHKVYGFTMTSNSKNYIYGVDCKFIGNDNLYGTDAGKYCMNLQESDFVNLNSNIENVRYVIEHDTMVILPMSGVEVTIIEHGGKFEYDGTEHTVSGYDARFNTELYGIADFKFTGDSIITATEVGEYSMDLKESDFENINPNFTDVTFIIKHDQKMEIEKIDGVQVIVKKRGAVLSYNGEVQRVTGYDIVRINDQLYTENDFRYIGSPLDTIASRQNIGKVTMSLTADDFENINESFSEVHFVVMEDSLTIIPNDHEVVTIHEGAKLVPFDGQEHEVTGFTFTSESGYYTRESFQFVGRDTVRGTAVGAYSMNLKPSDFINIDTNYVNPKFVIVHDSLAIVPLQAIVVTIYEHADTLTFNGKKQTVTGYDIESSISYYDAKDFVFTGDSTVSGTHVGEYTMKLKESDFHNINTNFTDVTFKVVPAVTKIVPMDVLHVTIRGNRDTVTYDGAMHVVKGYTSEAEEGFEFYKEFKFNGTAEATGYKLGEYPMNLKAEDFVNTSKDYTKVIFKVEDGLLKINKVAIPIVITANSFSKVYDGTRLTNDGYSYTIEALQKGDRIKATIQGTITHVGETVNKVVGFRILRGTEDVTDNYTIGRAVDGKLVVTPRPITLTSASDDKVYDGTALTNDSIEVGGMGWAHGEGAIYQVTGSQTEVGASSNVFDYALTLNTRPSDYEIDTAYGVLTVYTSDERVIITAASETFVYDGKEHSNSGYTVSGYPIAKGDTLYAEVEGSLTHVGEVENKVVSYRVMRNGQDVTKFYNFGKTVSGTLVVKPRRVVIESMSAFKEYDGVELTNDSVVISGDGWVEGEEAVVTVDGTQLFPGESYNTFEVEMSDKADISDYDTIHKVGILTVGVNTHPISIVAASDSKVYDGRPLENSNFTYTDSILAEGDILYVEIEGSITEVGVDTNRIVSYRVMRDDVDVTEYYTFGNIENGVLKVHLRIEPDKRMYITGVHHSIEIFNMNKTVRVYDVLGRMVKINGSFEAYAGEYLNIDVMNQGVYEVVTDDEEAYKVIVR